MQLSGNTVACRTHTESHTLLLRNWVTHLLHLQLAQQCHTTIEIHLGYVSLSQQCQRINSDLCDLCATTVSSDQMGAISFSRSYFLFIYGLSVKDFLSSFFLLPFLSSWDFFPLMQLTKVYAWMVKGFCPHMTLFLSAYVIQSPDTTCQRQLQPLVTHCFTVC